MRGAITWLLQGWLTYMPTTTNAPPSPIIQASAEILQLLQGLLRLGCPLEKGGLDEVFMDVTEMAVSSTLMYTDVR